MAGICLLVLWILSKNPLIIIVPVIVVVAVLVVTRTVIPAHARRHLIEKANALIEQNAEQLGRRRAQLVRRDAYGKLMLDKWTVEINDFISQHIEPSLTRQEQSLLRRERPRIVEMIMGHVEDVTRDRRVFETFSDRMTPTEFEVFCGEQLRESGWDARVTQRSRDQGVDVIAEKGGRRIVLQCKLYSSPVGNKAVQEAVAARAFEQAHYCAVVSNSSYTSAAEQLASANSVLLLHYSDLKRIETLIQGARVSN